MAEGQASPVALAMDNVAAIRGGRLVFQKLSLNAVSSDIIWLRGANGSGKSTLLRLIAGLLPLATGSREVSGKLALVDDNHVLDAGMSIEQALLFWARIDGNKLGHLPDILSAFDLTPIADIPIAYLSTGQRKRAALACMLASGADIWLLDEPYNGLDSSNCARLDAILLKHAQQGGIAVVAAHQPTSINVTTTIVIDAVDVGETA